MPGNLTVDELLTAIRSADADVRTAAWLQRARWDRRPWRRWPKLWRTVNWK